MKVLYTAEALATGDGRNGRARTSDSLVDVELAVPRAMGGSGNGTNPEQLFAAGYAACFHSALHMVARETKADLGESSVGAQVHIGPNDGGGFGLAVTLEVVIPNLPHDQAVELAQKAHQVCPYSNATRGNVNTELKVTND
jgi:lipoyl-dependent peroxiredoxin